jgi:hypothetical protein
MCYRYVWDSRGPQKKKRSLNKNYKGAIAAAAQTGNSHELRLSEKKGHDAEGPPN